MAGSVSSKRLRRRRRPLSRYDAIGPLPWSWTQTCSRLQGEGCAHHGRIAPSQYSMKRGGKGHGARCALATTSHFRSIASCVVEYLNRKLHNTCAGSEGGHGAGRWRRRAGRWPRPRPDAAGRRSPADAAHDAGRAGADTAIGRAIALRGRCTGSRHPAAWGQGGGGRGCPAVAGPSAVSRVSRRPSCRYAAHGNVNSPSDSQEWTVSASMSTT